MSWLFLIVTGVFECVWSTTMKLSEGFSRPGYAVATVVGMVVSFAALIRATKELPISLAYPIWTGIGAVGAVLVGVFLFRDRINPVTCIFVAMLIVGIIGIKLTSGE